MIEIGILANQIVERLRAKHAKLHRKVAQSRASTILDHEDGKISFAEAEARWSTPIPRLATSDGKAVNSDFRGNKP